MAHYAFIDDQNIVTEVIVGRDETEGDWETYYANIKGQRCIRTSYNGNIRGRFAGIGHRYDETLDKFISIQPFPSWTLDDQGEWQPPKPAPTEGLWVWDETNLQWVPNDNPPGFGQ